MATKTDLVIVESPSKAKTIGKYLGPGYEVKASMGHIRDLPKSKIGVELPEGSEQVDLTKHFTPNYQAIKGKEDPLMGLKENVIIGKLVPAGTGMPIYNEVEIDNKNASYYSSELVGANTGESVYDTDNADQINLF